MVNRNDGQEESQIDERRTAAMHEIDHKPDDEKNGTARIVCGVAFLILRVVLASLFIFSGAAKLGFLGSYGNTPIEFATAIRKFQIVQYDLIPYLAFIIPWVEVTCGILLLIGLSTRAASIVLNMLLASFTVGMLLVIARGIQIGDCSCFGGRLAAHFGAVGRFLEAPVGWTSVCRNVILMGLCLIITMKGAGMFSLDYVALSNRERSRKNSIVS